MTPDVLLPAAGTLATILLGALGFFLRGIAEDMRKTAEKVEGLVATLGRHDERAEGHGRLLGRLEAKVDSLEARTLQFDTRASVAEAKALHLSQEVEALRQRVAASRSEAA